MRVYPPDDDGFTSQQMRTGQFMVYADITCPSCGKEQPVAATGYLGGPCVRCGNSTTGPSLNGSPKHE